jgi:hypothetical protein
MGSAPAVWPLCFVEARANVLLFGYGMHVYVEQQSAHIDGFQGGNTWCEMSFESAGSAAEPFTF